MTSRSTIIVVDVQNDFCEGGALAISGGISVAEAISRHLRETNYDHVVATRDYHINPGTHFSENPDFIHSWPRHCVAGTAGAGFHSELDISFISAVFSKGQYSDGYSGFEGHLDSGFESGISLPDWLNARQVTTVDIVGLATDHCVRATALDARKAGFTVRVLLDLTAAVSPVKTTTTLEEFRAAGVTMLGKLRAVS